MSMRLFCLAAQMRQDVCKVDGVRSIAGGEAFVNRGKLLEKGMRLYAASFTLGTSLIGRSLHSNKARNRKRYGYREC